MFEKDGHRLFAGFSPQRLRLSSMAICVGFVVHRVALEQIIL
jgi:hypothetical protein